jgi:hypothetical protein
MSNNELEEFKKQDLTTLSNNEIIELEYELSFRYDISNGLIGQIPDTLEKEIEKRKLEKIT